MKRKVKSVKEAEGTLFFFLNSVTSYEQVKEMEKELSEKTGKKAVVLDARFKETIIDL